MLGKFSFAVVLGLTAVACAPPLDELHAKAASDFNCPPKSGLIDTRTQATPVTLGSSDRMKVQGCGQHGTYHWDAQNHAWIREPEVTTTSATTP